MRTYMGTDSKGNRSLYRAETRGKAKHHFSKVYGIEFFDVRIQRAKYADPYPNQESIPKAIMLANGWRLECACGRQVNGEIAEVIDEVVYCSGCSHQAVVN